MNICNKCPNKTLCKAGIAFGAISLIVSSYFLCKKLLSKKVKKSSPGPGNPGVARNELRRSSASTPGPGNHNGADGHSRSEQSDCTREPDASEKPDVQL